MPNEPVSNPDRINSIQILRGPGLPSSSLPGELAYDTQNQVLLIGDTENEGEVLSLSLRESATAPVNQAYQNQLWLNTSTGELNYYNKVAATPAWSLVKGEAPSQQDIVNMIYPVGSIYMSVNNVSPAVLFGGTWEQIEDTFLLSAGQTYTAGDTGGSADAIVVSHNHTFTGTSVTSGGQSQTHSHTFTGTEVTTGNQTANHNHSHNGAFLKWASNVTGTVALDGRTYSASGWKGSDQSGMVNTTGNNSANHGHKVTAKGTIGNASQGHTHSVTAAGTISTDGSSGVGANMPPYLTVYMWKRTA